MSRHDPADPDISWMVAAEREEARNARDVAPGPRSRWEAQQAVREELNVGDWW